MYELDHNDVDKCEKVHCNRDNDWDRVFDYNDYRTSRCNRRNVSLVSLVFLLEQVLNINVCSMNETSSHNRTY